jgi:GTPase Era involved in 16S rRNA processing
MSDFARFQDRKRQLTDAVDRLLGLLPQASIPTPEIRQIERFKQELGGELIFKLLCVGDFSTGKSTFVNRFLLGQDLLPTDALPTTAVPTRIRYGEQLQAIFYREDGSVVSITEGVAKALEDAASADGTNSEGVVSVIVETPSPNLAAGVEVVDAPGLNDPNAVRMQQTLDYLDRADAILFFLKATQPFTSYQRRFFEGDILSREALTRVFIILNWWDLVPADQRNEVLTYVHTGLDNCLDRPGTSRPQGNLDILPVSSKTGENGDAVQRHIWDTIGDKKFTDVLSIRLQRFNSLVERHSRTLDGQLNLLDQDRRERKRRRDLLEQVIDDYRHSSEQWRHGLARQLQPEFRDYRNRLGDVFDQMAVDGAHRVADIAANFTNPRDINARLATEMALVQKRATAKLRDLDEDFLRRVRDIIERERGQIDAASTSGLTLEEFFLRWPEVAEYWEMFGGQLAGGIGLGGVLVGAAAYIQTLTAAPVVAPGALASLAGLFGMGAPAAAAAAPAWIAFGVPGIVVGVLGLITYWVSREVAAGKLKQQLKRLSDDMATSIEQKKWDLLAGVAAQEANRIATICNNVDCEITQTFKEKLAELDQIDGITDNGEALRRLRDDIASLALPVNP